MTTPLNPTYDEIHKACEHIAEQITKSKCKYDFIVGLTRGGLIPAVQLSHMLNDIPVIPVSYSSNIGKGNNQYYSNVLPMIGGNDMPGAQKDINHPTIILIDELTDSGHTLLEVFLHYVKQGLNVHTAVLYHKTHSKPPIIPDFYWKTLSEDSGWLILPWERKG